MNRKKKINQTLIAKDKKKKAKLHGSNKPKYVSKAERERLATLAAEEGASQRDASGLGLDEQLSSQSE